MIKHISIRIYDAISKLLEREVKIIHIDPIKLKSLNKGKYEEIIYDKNPSFTLNNKRAKEVSRNTNFDVDIIESLRSTLQNLEKEDKEDVIRCFNKRIYKFRIARK